MANRAKHGVSLAEGALLDWTVGEDVPDFRQDYGEDRSQRVAPLHGRLYVCVFTLRADRIRVISLRKANVREVRNHG